MLLQPLISRVRSAIIQMSRQLMIITPPLLHHALVYGTYQHVELLLSAGADVTARNDSGSTPLHRAAQLSTPQIIDILLKAGADVMARTNSGETPLHYASWYPTFEGVRYGSIEALLAAGADPKAKDNDGKTPWDYAQQNKTIKDTKSCWALHDVMFN